MKHKQLDDRAARHIAENPDGCSKDELCQLVGYIFCRPRTAARRLWGVKPGFKPVVTVKMLAEYCVHAAVARESRLAGSINVAFGHEYMCDAIYNNLPEDVRWQ